MRRILSILALLVAPLATAQAVGIDDAINSTPRRRLRPLSARSYFSRFRYLARNFRWWCCGWLSARCFSLFTWALSTCAVSSTRFELVRGDYADPNSHGEVSHFQALATAVSGTVGIGNIGGVAVAVTVGGAGATFWLIVAGFLGMSTKFVECTLGVKYRNEFEDGSRVRRADVLPAQGFQGARHGRLRQVHGHLLCDRYLHRRAGYRQHVPVQPGLRAVEQRIRRRARRRSAGWLV